MRSVFAQYEYDFHLLSSKTYAVSPSRVCPDAHVLSRCVEFSTKEGRIGTRLVAHIGAAGGLYVNVCTSHGVRIERRLNKARQGAKLCSGFAQARSRATRPCKLVQE